MELDKKICPVLNVDGQIASGKQYDVDVVIPEDNRNVIYGVIKDCFKEPICNAVVKLIEVERECGGKEKRRPVAHTFTNESGEFVFGPLCPHKFYEIKIWVNRVRHIKICAKSKHEGKCLKGVDMDCYDFTIESTHGHCKEFAIKSELAKEGCPCGCHCEEKKEDCPCHCHHEEKKEECPLDCHRDEKKEKKNECKNICKNTCKKFC